MTALIAASAMRTCLGDGPATFAALLRGACGAAAPRELDGERLGVPRAYPLDEHVPCERFRASRWLAACVCAALADAGVDARRRRVHVIVGTGLRELREVERWGESGAPCPPERLHFGGAVADAIPGVERVVTLANACSAGGHALALAQDLVELGETDVAVAAATDAMSGSMLAMIGRLAQRPAARVRPFDVAEGGALLGEGAVALVVVPEGDAPHPLARVLATGLSCDATHETAADPAGIERAVRDAFARAGRTPAQVDLVLAHATGTPINDRLEATLLHALYDVGPRRPLVTALKGAIGHTSGAAALMSVDVAIRCLRERVVPPIVGLRRPRAEAAGLRLVRERVTGARLRLAQVNAFGFGGVNAVTLLEAAA